MTQQAKRRLTSVVNPLRLHRLPCMRLIASLFSALLLSVSASLHAEDYSWTCSGSNSYYTSDDSCWTPGTGIFAPPFDDGDNLTFNTDGKVYWNGNGEYDYLTFPYSPYIGTLNFWGGEFTIGLTIEANAENFGIGETPAEIFHGRSQVNTTQNLSLGFYSTGKATYNLDASDNTFLEPFPVHGYLTTNNEYIGNSGIGIFKHFSGDHTVTNALYMGYNTGSYGDYRLFGGNLLANNEFIGLEGTGIFTQNMDAEIAQRPICIGYIDGVCVPHPTETEEYINILYDGGIHRVSNDLFIGYHESGEGTYNLHSGSLSVDYTEIIGFNGTGTFNQIREYIPAAGIYSTPGNNSARNLTLGYNPTGSGTYNLTNGSLNVSVNEFIGYSGTGTFNQFTAYEAPNSHSIGGSLYLGYNDTGTGFYNLHPGNFLTVNDSEYIGHSGTGTFTQIHGTNTLTSDLYIGHSSTGSGVYFLDGGTISVGNRSYIGHYGTGMLNISNGAVFNKRGYIGTYAGSYGTVSVDGIGSTWQNTENLYIGNLGTGNLSISNGGVVSSVNAYIGNFGGSNGIVSVDGAGSSWANSGDLYVGRLGTGSLSVTNEGSVTAAGTMTVSSSSEVNLNNGSLSAALIDNQGQIKGTGFITADVSSSGLIGPGQSPGMLNINGDFTQTTDGILVFEIGGLLAVTEYDVLNITGTANLGGTLDVDWYDIGSGLFNASAGDSFDILSADKFYGEFDILTLTPLGGGLNWQLDYLLDEIGTTDIVRLSVVSTVPVPAAVWLFGSGLVCLIGLSRRKNKKSKKRGRRGLILINFER